MEKGTGFTSSAKRYENINYLWRDNKFEEAIKEALDMNLDSVSILNFHTNSRNTDIYSDLNNMMYLLERVTQVRTVRSALNECYDADHLDDAIYQIKHLTYENLTK